MPNALDFISAPISSVTPFTAASAPKVNPLSLITPTGQNALSSITPPTKNALTSLPSARVPAPKVIPSGNGPQATPPVVMPKANPLTAASAPTKNPLDFISKPIVSVLPELNIKSLGIDLKLPTSGGINDVAKQAGSTGVDAQPGALEQPMAKAPDWNDVGNILLQPVASGVDYFSSMNQLFNGKPYPSVNIGGQNTSSYQQQYAAAVKGGESPTKAFVTTGLMAGLDIANIIGAAQGLRGIAKIAVGVHNPTSLIDTNLVKSSSSDVRDFLTGRTTKLTTPLPQDAQQAIIDALAGSDRNAKVKLLGGIDTVNVKPSALGKLLGVSQQDAQKLLSGTYGTDAHGIRASSAGELPGYRERPGQGPAAGLSVRDIEPVGEPESYKAGQKPNTSPLDFIKDNSIKDIVKDTADDHSPTLPEGSKSGGEGVKETSPAVGEGSGVLEGINQKQDTKLTPEETAPLAQKAADQYWNEKIQPDIDAGKPIVIGADDMKDHFGGDYNDNNHPVYSRAAYLNFERALKANPTADVYLTGGGPASGKTEVLTSNMIKDGFKGIIYDSNMSSYDNAVKQINQIRAAGKKVTIYGVIPDLEMSRKFSIIRENEIGRGISDATFARGHAGFPATIEKLIENKIVDPKDIHLADTRKPGSFAELKAQIKGKSEYSTDPLALVKSLGYNEAELKQTYAKENFDKITGERRDPTTTRKSMGATSREDRPNTKPKEADTRASGRGDGKGVGKEVTSKTLDKLENQLSRNKQSLAAAKENPSAHIKAYGRDMVPEYESRIADIKAKINQFNIEDPDAKSLNDFLSKDPAGDEAEAYQKGEAFKIAKAEEVIKDVAARSKELGYTPDITERNHGILPPNESDKVPTRATRAGIPVPEIDWSKFEDIAAIRLGRDTMERNIEKVAPLEDADKLKQFLIDPMRVNTEDMTRAMNDTRLEVREKMEELGIKSGTKEAELVMHIGEGRMSVTDLGKYTKKVEEVREAARFFRKQYDSIIDKWNEKRAEFGYSPVPKLALYFRHFNEVDWFTKNFGFLKDANTLPTSIAGKTEWFKPGKPFSSAELKRLGKDTAYDSIKGFDNYISSVYKQMYQIDTMSRGRAIQKYLENVAKAGEAIGQGIKLQNFSANLHEFINTQVSGKLGALDRAVEARIGRRSVAFLQTAGKWIGRNIIQGNVSAALSHTVSIPLNVATVEKVALVKGLLTTLTAPLKADNYNVIDGRESGFMLRRYPIEYIQKDAVKTIEEALGVFMSVADRFKVRLAVSSKYYEGLSNGLSPEAAMKDADGYAGRIVGDYSLGGKPNIMHDKTMGLMAQFELGMNDGLSVLLHDIPKDAQGSKWKMIGKYIQFAIASYLLNEFVLKKLKGSGKGIDPIDLGLTLLGENDEGKGQSIGARAILAATDLAGELPFANIFTGSFPVSTPLQQIESMIAGKTPVQTGLISLASELASPFGGGLQAKKTIQGIAGFQNQLPEDKTIPNAVDAAIFGKAVLPSSVSTNTAYGAPTAAKQADVAFQATFNSIQALKNSGDITDANARYNALSATDKKTYDRMKAAAGQKTLLSQEYQMFNTVKANRALKTSGDPVKMKQADDYYNSLSPAQQKVYDKVKAKYFPGNSSLPKGQPADAQPTTDSTGTPQYQPGDASKPQGIIQTVLNYAEAIGTDPVTAFNRIFTGQKIVRVDSPGILNSDGAVIVQRAPLADTEAVRSQDAQQQNLSSSTMKGLQLDHIIPLEAGGSNTVSNYQLVTTEQNEVLNGLAENPIAKALTEGKISRANAREYLIRYKTGTLKEPLTPAMQSEYKNEYDSQPITAAEIQQLIDSGKAK